MICKLLHRELKRLTAVLDRMSNPLQCSYGDRHMLQSRSIHDFEPITAAQLIERSKLWSQTGDVDIMISHVVQFW